MPNQSIIFTSTNLVMNFEIYVSNFGLTMEENNSWFQLRNSIQKDCMEKILFFNMVQHKVIVLLYIRPNMLIHLFCYQIFFRLFVEFFN